LSVKRLLIVEDDPWVLRTLCGTLRRRGSRIDSATTVRGAREKTRHTAYDAILCEHHLSDGSGLELLCWLRWQRRISVPFLLIARSEEFSAAHARDFGVLAPPLRADRLLAGLQALVRDAADGILACQIPFAAEVA
jgi:DNA-binding response OmpR family regulator